MNSPPTLSYCYVHRTARDADKLQVFNRETREDGGMPDYERSYLNDTFMHTGIGIGIIGLSARAMFQSGFIYRLMATNPWVVMIGGMALSIGTMMGTRATDPSK